MTPKTPDILRAIHACGEAREWAGDREPQQAWDECPRGDWLLYAAAKLGVRHQTIVLAACDCAETVKHLWPAGDDRPAKAIEAARAWCRGEATVEEVREAARNAYAAYAAYAGLAANAAYAAFAAAYAAYAFAAGLAAYAVNAAVNAAARKANQQQTADLVRRRIPWPVVRAAIEERVVVKP